ncbi:MULTISPECIES: CBS domain-containing protein [Microbacterium]|jgi:CBS domain-containing protein|uniref:CBS domain-containing protein n=1 Tax=Microbacterium algeriense TaxID=2615184 RepID=A0ABQ6VDA5_9MICO|nr:MULTISPECIES: CBS domain-containing protein [Microbacterium]AZH79722.1 CBS domain-containing protein [Microbacterium sp. Y-01]KAB1867034.1 CBS domain-containing protein [Microbacterium algeriense]MDX2400625.1 CBS domain-containing protein [Microbacterium algeriense]
MTTTRDIMTTSPRCIGVNDSLSIAASLMADLDVGALPICGEDSRLKGMLTDRDIVVNAIARGLDPETTPTSALAQGTPITVGADDDVRVALGLMQENQVRRLPVIADHRLVGIISQADIARSLSAATTGKTVEEISK